MSTAGDVAAEVAVPLDRSRAGRFARHPRTKLLFTAVLALMAASAALSFRVADADSGYDLLGLLSAAGYDAAHLRWQYASLVFALAGAHYLATAVASRAAAGRRLPLAETVLVQLAASAANRITPAGLGGSAVTTRYFIRRGRLPVASAIGAVVALDFFGAAADLTVLTALILFGGWVGLRGGNAEVGRLSSKLTGMLAPLHSVWTWAVLAALVILAAALLRSRVAGHLHTTLLRLALPIKMLMRRPRSLVSLLGASAATTLVLALAFAVSVRMVPGANSHAGVGTLVIGFMLGSAASNAIPTPAGVGATETALVSVLVLSGMPISHSVEVVVVFRVITFWIPPLLGVLAGRRLRRQGAI